MMNKGVIVCVDDERLVLISLRDQLSRLLENSYDIELAESGEEALVLFDELQQSQIEVPLVICDQTMPDMLGDELLSELHHLYPKTLKILLTGMANLDNVVKAINRAQLYRYIAKPWDETDLGLTVKEAIRSYFQSQQLIEQNEALQQANRSLQQEIRDRQQAQKLLKSSEERLESILNSLDDVVWSASADRWELLYLNPAAEKLYGRHPSELLERPNLWWEVVHPEDRQLVEQFRHNLPLEERLDLEYRILQPTGDVRWLKNRSRVILAADGSPDRIDGIIYDITERKQAEEQLVHDALHDALTGLPNRTLLTERIETLLKRSQRHEGYLFAILFIDLDRFQVINDSLGHELGDRLLIEIAQKLETTIRTTDTIARLGGDEFVILLDSIGDVNDAIRVAERISQELKAPLQLGESEVSIAASIGIVLSSSDYEQAIELLRDADIAMYRAKEKGKACYEVFDRIMYAHALKQLQLENDLRQALERQEFQVYYQPIVSASTRAIKGFEALIRWIHPVRGFVSPVDFIPLAEETGLIVPIGEWVLRTVCQQIVLWQTQGFAVKVSVNLSGKQLQESDLVAKIDRILLETGVQGSSLELEITESMLMERVEELIEILHLLRERGIMLSIDDFGTGYSSLSYLHRFPVDYLKVDRLFVKDMAENHESGKITESIVNLARNLNKKAIAEGVETEAQLDRLRQLGCAYIQGYLFSPPVPASKATELLKTAGNQTQNQ
ncbi:MAG: EAL domain-containing protein [Cyanosarcina radialis HA8281-LM2]|jgi:diguanylate cyclase (GGDEF)-like protein/PAS domain S-box-containing protein|nr:EAL domain-containing protein [Cyanosarcina radialis HA8281-LM2]